MSTLEHQLATIRPRIEKISPIAGHSMLAFGIFNILLGLSLFFYHAQFSGSFSLFNAIFNYQVWGVLFFLVGATQLWAYWKNDWKIMRYTLIGTVTFSAMWAVALSLYLLLGNYDNIFLLLVWLSLTIWKVLVYIFFLPMPPKGVGDE